MACIKLKWLAENDPDAVHRAATLLMPKDWINFRLTGLRAQDATEASLSFLMDWRTRDWSDSMCDVVGVERRLLPDLREPGDVLSGLLPDVAGHDHRFLRRSGRAVMRAVLWDMDGTLLDSEPAHEAAFHAAVNGLGLTVPTAFHDRLLGASGDRVHQALCAETAASLALVDWLALKDGHFRKHVSDIRRLPAAGLTERLAAQGVPQALVSNSAAGEIALCLAAVDLRFDVTVSRGDVSQGKPDPEGYLHAARHPGIAPRDCMVVEDSRTGAAAGLAAGMTVVYHPQLPDDLPPVGARYLEPGGSLTALTRALGLRDFR